MFRVFFMVLFGSLIGVGLLEQKLLYPFDPTRINPHNLGLPEVSERVFENEGEAIVVWVAPPRSGKPVIFYLHGNAGNLATRANRFRMFIQQGYGLVAMAYRGSSGSSGTPSEKAIISDVRALYRDLNRVLPTNAPRVLYGESLGTGIVTVALIDSPERRAVKPARVILEAPYTSIKDVALAISKDLAPLTKHLTSRWNSAEAITSLHAPLLVVHGTKDEVIPFAQGRAVFAAAPSSEKAFLAVENAGHTDLWRADIVAKLWRFIDGSAR